MKVPRLAIAATLNSGKQIVFEGKQAKTHETHFYKLINRLACLGELKMTTAVMCLESELIVSTCQQRKCVDDS